MNMPLENSTDPNLGLCNPYSKAACLMMHLYSMEIGNPQLFAELNRVSRDLDITYLEALGPFSHALWLVTWKAEK